MSTASTQNLGPLLFAINVAFPALSVFIVAARIYTRAIITRHFSHDDYFIIAALILSLVSSAFLIPSIASGLGRHIIILELSSIPRVLKWLFAANITSITALFLAKLSISALLLPLSPRKIFSGVIYGIVGLSSVNLVFSYVVIFAQCRPFSRQWNIVGTQKGFCWSADLLFTCHLLENAVGILTSFLFLFLTPIILLKKPLNFRERLAVLGILTLGAFAVGISIFLALRTVNLLNSGDPTFTHANTTQWSLIQLHITILAASLPSLRPVFPFLSTPSAKLKSRKFPIDIATISHPRPTVPPKEIQGMEDYYRYRADTARSLDKEEKSKVLKNRREAMGWREVSFRESTQDFLLGLFPKGGRGRGMEDREREVRDSDVWG